MADSPMPTLAELRNLPSPPLTLPRVITDSATKFNPWLQTDKPSRADRERPWATATHIAPSLLVRHILCLRCLVSCQVRWHAECVARIREAPRPVPFKDLHAFGRSLFPNITSACDDVWGQVREGLLRITARVALLKQEIEMLWKVVQAWKGGEDGKVWVVDKALENAAEARKAGCNVHYERYHLAVVLRRRGGLRGEI